MFCAVRIVIRLRCLIELSVKREGAKDSLKVLFEEREINPERELASEHRHEAYKTAIGAVCVER